MFVVIAFGALATVGFGASKLFRGGGPPATSTSPYVPMEIVQQTLPLELGEGDARGTSHEVVFVKDGFAARLVAGTRVERLIERGSHKKPANVAASWVRIRIKSGPHDGAVAYVHPMYVQAAR